MTVPPSFLFFRNIPTKPPWTTVCSSFTGRPGPCPSSLRSPPQGQAAPRLTCTSRSSIHGHALYVRTQGGRWLNYEFATGSLISAVSVCFVVMTIHGSNASKQPSALFVTGRQPFSHKNLYFLFSRIIDQSNMYAVHIFLFSLSLSYLLLICKVDPPSVLCCAFKLPPAMHSIEPSIRPHLWPKPELQPESKSSTRTEAWLFT
jgi:hypothetical protein